jgi:hypothetical protein
MGLILDSSAVIAAERGGETAERLVERVVRIAGDQETALSAVGLTELVHGLYRAHHKLAQLPAGAGPCGCFISMTKDIGRGHPPTHSSSSLSSSNCSPRRPL